MPEPGKLLALLELGTFNPKMGAFECCKKLGEAGEIYRKLYPGSDKPGRRSGQRLIGFALSVASRVGMSRQRINEYVTTYAKLTPASRASLRLNDHGATMKELRALAELSPKAQANALDLMNSSRAATMREALVRAGGTGVRLPRGQLLSTVPSAALAAELRARGWTVTERSEDG